MNDLNKNSNGFTVVEVLLVIVTLAIIGGAGYFVAKHIDNQAPTAAPTSATTKSATTAKTTTTPAPSPYAGWNTYTLAKEKLTFRYPTTWTVENNLTNSSNDGIQFTSKTDSNFEILIGAGQGVAAVGNDDGNCVQQADPVTFNNQTAYLDLVGFANTNAVPPSCTPASSTIQSVVLSKSSTLANVSNFFLTKNIPQPAAPSSSEIVVDIDYNAPNGTGTNNKTLSAIESDADYKDAKLVVASMSY